MVDKVNKSDAEWKAQLTPEQYKIARKKGTERAFTGEFWDSHEPGMYRCVCCGVPLFDSVTKFDSGTGWPSFYQPIAEKNVAKTNDNTFMMERVAVVCKHCDAHLGHVFDDGPGPNGQRYCINGCALTLDKK